MEWLEVFDKKELSEYSNYEEYNAGRIKVIIWPDDKLFSLEIKDVTRIYRMDFTDLEDLFQLLCRDRLFRAIYYRLPVLPVF